MWHVRHTCHHDDTPKLIARISIAFRAVVVSPARALIYRLIGFRLPGGLGFIGESLNRGLPPAATVGRPPAADFPDVVAGRIGASMVGLVCRRLG